MVRPAPRRVASGGFTLLEVLIALAIFAWIGVVAFRVFDTIMVTQSISRQHSEDLARLQKAMWLLSRDMQQLAARRVRDEYGDSVPALVSARGDYLLEFSRLGWRNPLGAPRSGLQRVAYEIGPHPDANDTDSEHYGDEKSYLLRHYWSVLDRAPDTEPRTQVLLPDINDLQFRFLDDSNEWVPNWPAGGSSGQQGQQAVVDPMPRAIEILIASQEFGELRRLFKIR